MPKAHQSVVLYKRHTPSCPVHETRLPKRRRRYWMECDCVIWMVGRTEQQVYHRQSTGFSNKEQALAYLDALLNTAESEKIHGPQLADCTKIFLESKLNEISDRTYRQYELLFTRLQHYCGKHGVFLMHDLTVDLLETFKVKGLRSLVKKSSKSTSVSKLRCFLADAYRRKWITEALAQKV